MSSSTASVRPEYVRQFCFVKPEVIKFSFIWRTFQRSQWIRKQHKAFRIQTFTINNNKEQLQPQQHRRQQRNSVWIDCKCINPNSMKKTRRIHFQIAVWRDMRTKEINGRHFRSVPSPIATQFARLICSYLWHDKTKSAALLTENCMWWWVSRHRSSTA